MQREKGQGTLGPFRLSMNAYLTALQCDENRPICRRCNRNDRSCLYPASNPPEKLSRQRELSGLSLQKRGTWAPLTQPPLNLNQLPLPLLVEFETPSGATSIHQLLHHFNQNYIAISETSFSAPVWQVARSHPYLLTAILAVSACHLRHHAPNPRAHVVAECYQQRLTLRGFQQALTRIESRDQSDALIMTAMFLNLLSFALIEDPRPTTSWVFSSSHQRLDWLSLLMGLKPLLMATQPFRTGTLLQPMFEAADDEKHTFSNDDVSMIHIPSSWLGLFTPYTAPGGNSVDTRVFQEPLRILALSRHIAPEPTNIYLYLQFIGKLGPGFLALIHNQDNRALWIMGYWLGLLGRFGFWWLRARCNRDYNAILIHLRQQRHNDARDANMWSVLMNEISHLRSDWHRTFSDSL